MKKIISLLLALMMAIGVSMSVFSTVYADEYDDTDYYEEDFIPDDVGSIYLDKISTNGAKLEWYTYSYCDTKSEGFEIAKYIKASDTYKTVATITKINSKGEYSYTVSGLSANTKYAFALRGYTEHNGVKYYGEYTEPVYLCTAPAETTIKSVKYISKGKVEVKWSAVKNISGYLLEYCTNTKFKNDGTTCYVTVSKDTTSKTITALAKKTYYIRVRTYVKYNDDCYCSDSCKVKSVVVKDGASVKTMINSISTSSNEGKKYIKEFTENGVDISKYNNTYDKFKAIYNWHSQHNTDYGWSCVGCNTNFNVCIAQLFKDKKKYDLFIRLACDNFKNSNGSVVMHKWSVIFLSGVPYIFDPRLQGYTSDKTGNTYFGVSPTSAVGKKYLFDGWYDSFPTTFEEGDYDYYRPYFSFPFISSVEKPLDPKLTATAKQGAIKLSWDKVSSAKGYQIQYSTKSDFSSAKTLDVDSADTLSKTLSSLGSNKTYYLRARAYKNFGSSKIYGFWSNTLKVKTRHINEANPTSIKTLAAKSKGFKVTWKKVDKASGYQLSYSKTKDFKKSTTKTYSKNSTTSSTISKLSGKTKYFVRVRTYKTVNGKKYYSDWCAVKAVKTK